MHRSNRNCFRARAPRIYPSPARMSASLPASSGVGRLVPLSQVGRVLCDPMSRERERTFPPLFSCMYRRMSALESIGFKYQLAGDFVKSRPRHLVDEGFFSALRIN